MNTRKKCSFLSISESERNRTYLICKMDLATDPDRINWNYLVRNKSSWNKSTNETRIPANPFFFFLFVTTLYYEFNATEAGIKSYDFMLA